MSYKLLVLCATLLLVHYGKCDKKNGALQMILSGVDKFGRELFSILLKSRHNADALFSPVGLYKMLAMIYLGSRGKTAQLLAEKLHIENDPQLVKGAFSQVEDIAHLKHEELNCYNQIFHSEGFVIDKGYERTLTKVFNTTFQTIDFSNSHEVFRKIEMWAKKRGLHHYDRDSAFEVNDLIFAQVSFLTSDWLHKFNREVHIESFYLENNIKQKVAMMDVESTFKMVENSEVGAFILELPLNQTEAPVSAVIVVPKERFGLQEVAEKILTKNLRKLFDFSSVSSRLLHVTLPRFSLDESHGLHELFEDSGLLDVVNEQGAQLGMSKSFSGKTHLKQYAQVSIDVNGIDANERNLMPLAVRSGPDLPVPSKSERIVVDQPFLFFIKGEIMGNILCMGKVDYPGIWHAM